MKINKKIAIVVLALAVFVVPGFIFAQQDSYGSLENCIDGGNTQDYCCTAFQYSACQSVNKCENKTCDAGFVCNPVNGECISSGTGGAGSGGSTGGSGGSSGGSGGGSGGSTGGSSATCNQGICPAGLCEKNGLCLPKSNFNTGIGASETLADLLIKIIQFLLTFAGVIAVGVLVIGGFWYITSAGNEEQAEKGQKAITNAIIGLVIVILAYTIIAIISSTLIADKFVK